tara:strand:+ start:428 stop:1279 length:852 start_codon:yes stop_codon:yes gene_type:complete
MPIALGSLPVSKIYLGLNEIDASYLGTDISFPEQDLLFTVDTFLGATLEVQFDWGVVYNATIDWGDGSPTFSPSFGTVQKTYDVLAPTYGTFQVRVSGTLPQMRLSDNQNIISVETLGNVGLQDTDTMFYACNNLASVNTGDYITSIGYSAFQYCTSLTSANIGNSVTSIGNQAFTDCSGLTSIIIGNSVTSIVHRAFDRCSSLTSIIIPDSVTSIGYQTFRDCTLLATIDLSLPKSVIDATPTIFIGTASPLTLNIPTGTTGWTAGTGQSIGGNTNVTVNFV